MNSSPSQLKAKNEENAARNVVLQGAICVVFAWLATRQSGVSLYVWFDVAAVYLLSSLVVGDRVATWLERHTRATIQRRSWFAVLVFLAALLAASQGGLRVRDLPVSASFMAFATARIFLAVAATAAAALLVRRFRIADGIGIRHTTGNAQETPVWLVWAAVASVAVVPQVYNAAA